jgi:hypothetical protein
MAKRALTSAAGPDSLPGAFRDRGSAERFARRPTHARGAARIYAAMKPMKALILAALLLAGLAPMAQAASTQTLFIIQRSINKNEVHYDARLDAEGRLDPSGPVEVYWLMLAEDGRREDLNWVERDEAYGFAIEAIPGDQSYRMTLKAEKNRPIRVYTEKIIP